MLARVIFKAVGDGRPYPEHGLSQSQWGDLSPTQVRIDELITTKREMDLDRVMTEDSTYFGDLFAHVVQWRGELYLEDGLHRALRAALQQRPMLHARVLELDDCGRPPCRCSPRAARAPAPCVSAGVAAAGAGSPPSP